MKTLLTLIFGCLGASIYSQECPDKFFIKGFIGCHEYDVEFVIKKTELDYNYNKVIDFEFDDSLYCYTSTITTDHAGFCLTIIHNLDEYYNKIDENVWFNEQTNISVHFSKGRSECTFIYLKEE